MRRAHTPLSQYACTLATALHGRIARAAKPNRAVNLSRRAMLGRSDAYDDGSMSRHADWCMRADVRTACRGGAHAGAPLVRACPSDGARERSSTPSHRLAGCGPQETAPSCTPCRSDGNDPCRHMAAHMSGTILSRRLVVPARARSSQQAWPVVVPAATARSARSRPLLPGP